jgi:hypothetical protein
MTNNVCKTFDCRKVLHFVGTGTNLFAGVLSADTTCHKQFQI